MYWEQTPEPATAGQSVLVDVFAETQRENSFTGQLIWTDPEVHATVTVPVTGVNPVEPVRSHRMPLLPRSGRRSGGWFAWVAVLVAVLIGYAITAVDAGEATEQRPFVSTGADAISSSRRIRSRRP